MVNAGRLRVVTGAAAALLACGAATPALAHPLHTTITQVAFRGDSLRAIIRVFADDFGRAVHGLGAGDPAPTAVSDSAAAAYVRSRFTITGAGGRLVTLRWCGMERREGAYLMCVAGAAGRMAGTSVHSRLHWELYADQVNIVQATSGRRRETLLFLRGDPPRRLPPA